MNYGLNKKDSIKKYEKLLHSFFLHDKHEYFVVVYNWRLGVFYFNKKRTYNNNLMHTMLNVVINICIYT